MPHLRSLACMGALLGASFAAPAGAVPMSPVAMHRIAPSFDEVTTELFSERGLCVTFDEAALPPGVRAHAPSVLLFNDPVGGFGDARDRFRRAEASE
jgi:hypothetical protein